MAASDKRTSGAPFKPPSANTWNGMVDAGEAFLASQMGEARQPTSSPRETDKIKVRNDSGADRARGEVLGTFGKSLTNLEPGHIRLTGQAPTTGKHFGILLKALPSGDTGDLQLSGVCLATVTISDTSHQYADLDSGAYKLISAETGPVDILWQPGSTGDQECFVRLGTGSAGLSTIALAKSPVGGIPAFSDPTAGVAEVTLHYLVGNTLTVTSPAVTVTAYNFSSTAVAANKPIQLKREYISDVWMVDFEDCG